MLNRTLENTSMFIGATYGASTRDVDKGLLTEYRLAVERMEFSINPPEKEIRQGIVNSVAGALRTNAYNQDDLMTLQKTQTRIESSRLAFTNDCCNGYPPEFLDTDKILVFLTGIRQRAVDLGHQLNVLEQYNLALKLTHYHPIVASLLAHISLRAVARNADTSYSESLQFPVGDLEGECISMVGVAESLADFGGNGVTVDPLGNSYHFWAQLNAGLIFTMEKNLKPFSSAFYRTLFYCAPEITTLIRKRIGGKLQQFGEHAIVDRQGHRVGCAVAHFVNNYLKDGQNDYCYYNKGGISEPTLFPKNW